MAEQKGNGFVNLKKIHDIQVAGTVQALIRDLRSTRIQLEHILSEASKIKKQKSAALAALVCCLFYIWQNLARHIIS